MPCEILFKTSTDKTEEFVDGQNMPDNRLERAIHHLAALEATVTELIARFDENVFRDIDRMRQMEKLAERVEAAIHRVVEADRAIAEVKRQMDDARGKLQTIELSLQRVTHRMRQMIDRWDER